MLARLRDDSGPDAAPAAVPDDVVSAIVPVMQDGDEALVAAWRAYRDALAGQGAAQEFVYVLAPGTPRARAALEALKAAGEPLVIVALSQSANEAAALRSGAAHARGGIVLTLSAYPQIEPEELPRVLAALAEADMVVARRRPSPDRATDSMQSAVFHWLIRRLFGRAFGDLVCRVRACRREVFEEIADYGTEHQFLPLLAAERGLRLRELDVRPRRGPPGGSVRSGLFARLRLILDILALFVVLKFLKRPLRFFGALGLPLLLAGLAYTGALALARLVFAVPLADRPALILGVLLIVLGIQIIALGLIGDIIFVAGKRIKDYTVEKVL